MLKRSLSAAVLLALASLAIFFRPLCLLMVTVFTLIGLWEFFIMIEKKQVKLFKAFGLILGGLIPISISLQFPITREWQLFFIVVALFTLFLLELTRKEKQETILSLSATVFGVLYISWCFSFIIRIRNLTEGIYLVWFLLIVVKAQDLGAYLIGTFFGRRPLLKRVSPKKSVEGSLGGIFFSIIFAAIFKPFLSEFSWGQVIFVGFILGAIGQLGDLFESLIKRDCQVKDSGWLIPGMGGVLDVIDSLIFTAPVFYFYVTMLKDIVFYPIIL